jgi:2,3-bisphosphoglycerate-independent phosphoglycerate mutase
MVKYLMLIPDGMADREIDSLGKKTPLEVADTPNMDFLAREGSTGMAKTIPEGYEPGSDIANLTILGLDVKKYYTGRGPLEALARGIKGEYVFRCNLVYVKNGIMMDYSGRRIDDSEAKEIINYLNKMKEIDFIRFYPGRSYRNLLVINRRFEDNAITTPPHDIQGRGIEEFLPKGGELASLLRSLIDWSANILKDLKSKTNLIWPWGGGKIPLFPSFMEMYGEKGVMISEVDLLQGIGKGLKMDVVEVEGMTGYIDTNYKGLVKATLKGLRNAGFVLLHTEGIDEVSHEGDVDKKVEAISIYDEKIVGYLLDRLDLEETRILLLPDHSTPIEIRTHSTEEVPFLIYGRKKDDVSKFSEKNCRNGKFGRVDGLELMKLFLYYRGVG